MKKQYKYIYGPVSSWRLGRSLGVDAICTSPKTCTFNCVYCQLGRKSRVTDKRKVYVSTNKIIEEIKALPKVKIDYITFSGSGEPTLAKNLGELIISIKKIRHEKIAVLTNAMFLSNKDVRQALNNADMVEVKLDTCSEDCFKTINKPTRNIKLKDVIKGIMEFREGYKGKLAIQIMFIEKNKGEAESMATLLKSIKPDEVHINTPLRPSGAKPLLKKEIKKIAECFKDFKTLCVYEKKKKRTIPINIKDTVKRRGKKI